MLEVHVPRVPGVTQALIRRRRHWLIAASTILSSFEKNHFYIVSRWKIENIIYRGFCYLWRRIFNTTENIKSCNAFCRIGHAFVTVTLIIRALCNNLEHVFYAVVRWRKLDEVENEYSSHNFIVLAIFVPKFIKVGENLTKFWQKQFWLFFETRCKYSSINLASDTV